LHDALLESESSQSLAHVADEKTPMETANTLRRKPKNLSDLLNDNIVPPELKVSSVKNYACRSIFKKNIQRKKFPKKMKYLTDSNSGEAQHIRGQQQKFLHDL
jgi:hypothetical protein